MILSKIDSFFRLALEFGLNMLNLTKSDASYSCGCLCMCVCLFVYVLIPHVSRVQTKGFLRLQRTFLEKRLDKKENKSG